MAKEHSPDASMQDDSLIMIPPNHEISPTKSSRQLMRQISGLGMQDPVFTNDFDWDDDDDNDGNDGNDKLQQASFTSTTFSPLMDLFDDMCLEDLPPDMRDALTVASDPTATYGPQQRQKFLPTYATAKMYEFDAHEQREDCSKEEEDTTTSNLTKNTLLAEAADALEGRVSSNLLAEARHQTSSRSNQNHFHHPHYYHSKRRGNKRAIPSPRRPVVNPSPMTHRILPTMEHIFPS